MAWRSSRHIMRATAVQVGTGSATCAARRKSGDEDAGRHTAVREARPSDARVPKLAGATSATRAAGRAERSAVRPRARLRHPKGTVRDLKGVFLDIFGGVGGVAKSASALGAHAEVWDTSFGDEYDLTRPRVLRRLLHRIRKGNILGAAIAMPCKSFSLARARRGAIRTKLWPWGIPEMLESGDGRDFDDFIEGNFVLKATIKIIQ